jgi:PmbA protein
LETREAAERLLDLIGRSDVDEGEVYVSKSEGLEISLRDQAVERLRNKAESGYGLRLIKDSRMAFVHSSDFAEDSLRRTVEKGADLARAVAPDPSNVLPGPSETTVSVDTYDPAFDEIDFDRKVSLLRDLETLAFAYDPDISKMEYLGYQDSKGETVVANTRGVFRQGRATSFSFWLSVVAEHDGDVETGGESSRSTRFEDLDLPSEVTKRACSEALALLGGGPVKTQTCPVIFDPDTGEALLAHLFAMVRGDNVAQGLSLLKGRIGERIGSDLVTVIDDATLPRGVASRNFDAEGVPSQRNVVVDGGVLRSFLYDTRAAVKMGTKSTGNASRGGFRDLPGVGNTNLFLNAGEVAPDTIIKTTDRGLWLRSLAGWWVGISPSTGDFSSGAKGLWVENGEVVHAVRNVTIASNVLEMLAGVNAVGDDLRFDRDTATPTFRIGEMMVGGV